MKIKRPILRWHGGKWMLAPWILRHIPPHKVYTELFGGAASVLLRKKRSYAEIYNDLDGEVVNLFRQARDHGDILRESLYLTPYSREEFNLSYQVSENPLEQARRTVVRSFMGFGSNAHNQKTGFRGKSFRSGSTGASDWKNYPDVLDRIIKRLRGVTIENRNAFDLLIEYDSEGTAHYIDPPYVFSERGDCRHDYRHELSDALHEKLCHVANSLKGMVLISAYESDIYNDILSEWKVERKGTMADGARPRVECLYINPLAVENVRQKSLFT